MKYELYEGDCLKIMPTLEAKSIDLGIVDPPYNIGKAEWDKFPSHEAYIEWMGKLFLSYQRVLKDNGSFYWFHSEMPVIAELMEWIKVNTDFIFKQMIVWNKRFPEAKNKGFLDGYVVVDGLRNYQQMAEYCLYYTFQDETGLSMIMGNCVYPVRDYIRSEILKAKGYIKFKEINAYLGTATNGGGVASAILSLEKTTPAMITEEHYYKLREYCNGEYLRREYEDLRREYEDLRYTFNNQKTHHSVWNYEIAKANGHETPKPPELIKNIIRHSSNEGDIILDACAGSGATGQAAIELDRFPVMIEKDETNCEYIQDRCNNTILPLFEPTPEPVPVEQAVLL